MRALVTGVAGFVGSQLAEALLDGGHTVTGLDALTEAYPSAIKRSNLSGLRSAPNFSWVEADLGSADLAATVSGHDVVFHLAATAGVRASWEDGFSGYVHDNILATQRLLEAVRHTSNARIVYAGSSSVYGNADTYPCSEDARPRPLSPYGVSKLAAEQLCLTYREAFDLDVVALRYFSVYGPRQRPDMGVHRIIEAARTGATFSVYGDGCQIRDMTFVGDVVAATIAAAEISVPSGTIANISGGSEVSLNDIISAIGRLSGNEVTIEHIDTQAGDVRRTGGDTSRAREILRWEPNVALEEGLRRQIAWHREVRPGDLMAAVTQP
jgi:UDP-glucuronate 4-epimerase